MNMGRISHKYRNIPKRVDGILFQSTKEARRYTELRSMQSAGVIRDLELQPKYRIHINGVDICLVVPDFRYYDNERRQEVVEDVKGVRTQMFVIKKRLMKAVLGVEIEET